MGVRAHRRRGRRRDARRLTRLGSRGARARRPRGGLRGGRNFPGGTGERPRRYPRRRGGRGSGGRGRRRTVNVALRRAPRRTTAHAASGAKPIGRARGPPPDSEAGRGAEPGELGTFSSPSGWFGRPAAFPGRSVF
ncbi:conserved hypothetical protein [Ixodes scapularis]|uniref:Uncharacterized protein n=1 Tax=Ixodes scapularis TaxID=6945 RepID=B7Q4S3_IXOSC|nr:conserved hypothetical protein [Ixodes scapularis]|eukprot:XP_002411611.1 conserved hypothetical protein [Ixodes scapularis]